MSTSEGSVPLPRHSPRQLLFWFAQWAAVQMRDRIVNGPLLGTQDTLDVWRQLSEYALGVPELSRACEYDEERFSFEENPRQAVIRHVLDQCDRIASMGESPDSTTGEAKTEQRINSGNATESPPPTSGGQSAGNRENEIRYQALLRMLNVLTNGVAEEKINAAARLLLAEGKTVNEKLTEIDDLIHLPPTASAEKLGEMLNVTKQAVMKTEWWIQNRKGEKEDEVGRRHTAQQKRSANYEPPHANDDEVR